MNLRLISWDIFLLIFFVIVTKNIILWLRCFSKVFGYGFFFACRFFAPVYLFLNSPVFLPLLRGIIPCRARHDVTDTRPTTNAKKASSPRRRKWKKSASKQQKSDIGAACGRVLHTYHVFAPRLLSIRVTWRRSASTTLIFINFFFISNDSRVHKTPNCYQRLLFHFEHCKPHNQQFKAHCLTSLLVETFFFNF